MKNINSQKGRVLLYSQILLMFIVIFAPYGNKRNSYLAGIGIIIIFGSIVIFWKAKRDLQKAFYPYPEPKVGAPFITSGIYNQIRHPMYFSFLAGSLGLALFKQTLLVATSFILLTLVLKLKYQFEDFLLRNRWEEAIPYQNQVPALIPRWRK